MGNTGQVKVHVRATDDLLALAEALEHEAATRHCDLSVRMTRQGDLEMLRQYRRRAFYENRPTTFEIPTILEIKPSHIYELLRPIWVEKRETANRVRGRIETIIAKNVDVDDADFRNTAELTK